MRMRRAVVRICEESLYEGSCVASQREGKGEDAGNG